MKVPRSLSWLARLPNYLRTFGLRDGLRLHWQVERPAGARGVGLLHLKVPGYPAPLQLRDTLSDRSIFWQCLVQRQYAIGEFQQTARLRAAYQALLDSGQQPLIVDCGGNIGLSALYLATAFPEARVCVIEPDDANFALLQQNLRALGARVLALHGAVWPESGRLDILNPGAGSASFRVDAMGEDGPGAVRAYTMDEVFTLAGGVPMVAKIDIEGAQARLFERNTAWVTAVHLIMLELDDWVLPWQGTSRSFFACVSRLPFDYILSGETIFCFRDWQAGSGCAPS